MKRFLVIFITLLLVVPAFAQWQYDNLSGMRPKVRTSIEELRERATINAIDDIWYVDANNGADAQGGRSWGKAVATITKAITLAGDYDVIMVAPGDYEELETQNITEAGLKIIGPGIDNQNVAMVYVADSSHHAFTVNANNVVISGLGFTVNEDGYDAIRVATTASAYKTTITDCRFDGYGQGEYVIHTGTTYDSPDIVVQNCVFRSWQTAAIYANATRGVYRDNHVITVAGKIGINIVPTTGSRPDQVFKDNVIQGKNSTDTGISFTGSPDENALTMVGNSVTNCATPVTLSKYTSFYEGNYFGELDWMYHNGWGMADAEARGANGAIFYCDGNISTAGDGKCWASAQKVLATAILQVDTWQGTSANRAWAKRSTLYIDGDTFTEDLVKLSEKTDIVGVGSYDANTQPGVIGNHVIDGTNYYGCRLYNIRFSEVDDGAMWTVPTTQSGLEFHGCTFDGRSSSVTHGIASTASYMLKVKGCRFIGPTTAFSTGCIVLAAGASDDNEFTGNFMRGAIGIVVNASTTTPAGHILVSDNYIHAATLCIDDNSDLAFIINNRLISSADQSTLGNCIDYNAALGVGNILTGSGATLNVPSTTD